MWDPMINFENHQTKGSFTTYGHQPGCFSPPARRGSLDFIRGITSASSTASSRAQWPLPDLNCKCQISVVTPDLNRERQSSVGTAGAQLREPDLSGHCWDLNSECKMSHRMSDRMSENCWGDMDWGCIEQILQVRRDEVQIPHVYCVF